ncbi:hypothetical protein [Marilutibacter alkalisoli]|nr:hypothetical protein [Lysobacter alkalisoli]
MDVAVVAVIGTKLTPSTVTAHATIITLLTQRWQDVAIAGTWIP